MMLARSRRLNDGTTTPERFRSRIEPGVVLPPLALKHEHIAAAHLRRAGIEVLLPQIRFKKATARGPVWVTEVLFPNYSLRAIQLARVAPAGASRAGREQSGVVRQHWPTFPKSRFMSCAKLSATAKCMSFQKQFSPANTCKYPAACFTA
jgi:hypothetical protein